MLKILNNQIDKYNHPDHHKTDCSAEENLQALFHVFRWRFRGHCLRSLPGTTKMALLPCTILTLHKYVGSLTLFFEGMLATILTNRKKANDCSITGDFCIWLINSH